jgi:NADPH-dependent curcumin reductase CurA
MTNWLRAGRLKYKEDITDGLENAPRELIGLLRGENFGKKIIRVSHDPASAATSPSSSSTSTPAQ